MNAQNVSKDHDPTLWRAWFEKYRPNNIDDMIFPDDNLEKLFKKFYNEGFVRGNILAYGPAGFGKTSLVEIFIRRIIKHRQDLLILGRKVNDIDQLKTWLLQQPIGRQKIVKIEEIDRLSVQAQTVLKESLMEKFQDRVTFLATTNNPQKLDPALITRFNIKVNFGSLPVNKVATRILKILNSEQIVYNESEVLEFVKKYQNRGLREIINLTEIASSSGQFDATSISNAFAGVVNEETVVKYIEYFVSYLHSKTTQELSRIIKNLNSDQNLYGNYYNFLKIMKDHGPALNFLSIYDELLKSEHLGFFEKNIVADYQQELLSKRFATTHTIALLNELFMAVAESKDAL